MENNISNFRNSRSILKLEFEKLALQVWKCHIDLKFYAKKNFIYSGVFKPYSDVLNPYSGVFLQNFFYKYRFRGSYSGVFKTYSDVLQTYSGVFSSINGNRVFKTRFSATTRVLDTRDASFQNCFEMWQLTKFFNIYCYLEKKFL